MTTLGEKLVSRLADELEFQGVKVLWGAGLERALLRNNRSFRDYQDIPSAVDLGARLGVPLVVSGKVEHRVFSAIDRDWALSIQVAALATDGSGGKARSRKRLTTGPAYVRLRKYFDRKSEIAVGPAAKKPELSLANELRSGAQALAARIRRVLGKNTRSAILLPVSMEGRGIPLVVLRSLSDSVEQRYRELLASITAKKRGAVARLQARRRNLLKQEETLAQRLASLEKEGSKGSEALARLRGKREAARSRLAAAKGELLKVEMQVAKAKADLRANLEALKRAESSQARLRNLLDAAGKKGAEVGALLAKELKVVEQGVAQVRALQRKIARRFRKAEAEASKARKAAAREAKRLASIVDATLAKNQGVPPSSQPSAGRSEERPGGQGAGLPFYEEALHQNDVLLEMAAIRSALAGAMEERSKLLALQSKAREERLAAFQASLRSWEAKLAGLRAVVRKSRSLLDGLEPRLAEAKARLHQAEMEVQALDERVAVLSRDKDRLDPKLRRAVELGDRIARALAAAEEALAQERLRDPKAEALASGPLDLGGQRFESIAQARMRVEELRRRAIQEASTGLRGQLLALLAGALADRGLRVRVLGRDLREAPRSGLAIQPTFKKIGDRFEFAVHFTGPRAPGARPSVTLDPRWTPLLQEAEPGKRK